PPAAPASLSRLRTRLFEPPQGEAVRDGAVELLTAPGEAAEVRAIVRRLVREAARGVPFEEMGIILPRPEEYAPLVTDLLERLDVPHRLHPSLPLRCGRSARSLLLLFRARGLTRAAVMESLTFAPVPFEHLLDEDAGSSARPSRWDAISRDAGIVSGLDRWRVGLRAHAEAERAAAASEPAADRAQRRRQGAAEAEALLAVVEALARTLEGLTGEATWPEWSERLAAVFDTWVGHERDREAVAEVLADLARLASVSPRAPRPAQPPALALRRRAALRARGRAAGPPRHVAGSPARSAAALPPCAGPGDRAADPFLSAGGSPHGTGAPPVPLLRGRGVCAR